MTDDMSPFSLVTGGVAGIAAVIAAAPRLWPLVWDYTAFLASVNPMPWIFPRELALTMETAGMTAVICLLLAVVVAFVVASLVDAVVGAVTSLIP